MSLFSTPTPAYKNQSHKPETEPIRGFWNWLRSLGSTPTPAYKTVPAQHTARHSQTALSPADVTNDNRPEGTG